MNLIADETKQSAVIIAALFIANVGFLATASRMVWAFARENGLPGSKILAQVHQKSALPLWAIGLSTTISMLLALVNIGSSTAFNALTSLVVSGFYATYIISSCVLLYHRVVVKSTSIAVTQGQLAHADFSMGRFGVPVAALSVLYSTLGIFFSFWPPTSVVNAATMNWSVAVFGGVILFSLAFWFVHGRKVYRGPIMETSS